MLSELARLQGLIPTTAHDMFDYAIGLMKCNMHFAASCILRLLHNALSDVDKPLAAVLLVNCGLAMDGAADLLDYIDKCDSPPRELVDRVDAFRQTALHNQMATVCKQVPDERPSWIKTSFEKMLVVCAGGDAYLKQLWCNLNSLSITGCTLPVTVVHASELSEAQVKHLMSRFGTFFPLHFLDLKDTPLGETMRMESLRGYQIKLAAVAMINCRHMIMMDADVLWINNPEHLLDSSVWGSHEAGIFRDIWTFNDHIHAHSASTRFIYRLLGVPVQNTPEFESGVVYIDREKAWKAVCTIRAMCEHHEFFFRFTFGDKDLYYAAFKMHGVDMSPLLTEPHVIGTRDDKEDFKAQGMLQYLPNGDLNHIHLTLHPMGDEFSEEPNVVCTDPNRIVFVQRQLGDRTVGTIGTRTKGDIVGIPSQHVVALAYRSAKLQLVFYESTRP